MAKLPVAAAKQSILCFSFLLTIILLTMSADTINANSADKM